MPNLIPSVIYVSRRARTVGADILDMSFTPGFGGASFSGTSVSAPAYTPLPSFTPQTSNYTTSFTTPSPSPSWYSGLGKGLLDLGGTIATGWANLTLQKAQLKAQAEANRPIIYSGSSAVPNFSGGGVPSFPNFVPSPAPASSNTKTLLYVGGAAALGLIAILALRKK